MFPVSFFFLLRLSSGTFFSLFPPFILFPLALVFPTLFLFYLLR